MDAATARGLEREIPAAAEAPIELLERSRQREGIEPLIDLLEKEPVGLVRKRVGSA